MGSLPSGLGLRVVLGVGAVIAVPMWLSQGMGTHVASPPPALTWSDPAQVDVPQLDPDPVATAERAAGVQREARNYWASQKVQLNAKPPKAAAQPKQAKSGTTTTQPAQPTVSVRLPSSISTGVTSDGQVSVG